MVPSHRLQSAKRKPDHVKENAMSEPVVHLVQSLIRRNLWAGTA